MSTNPLRSIDEVAAVVRGAQRSPGRTVVGIVGAPGAGKSTLAARLVESLGPTAALLPMDGFHLSQARLVELRRRDRMGAPDTFDVPWLLETLSTLTVHPGAVVSAPGFDRTIEEAVPGAIPILPAQRTIVVEGNYLLLDDQAWTPVRRYLDVSFFVRVDDDVRQQRLIARHERFGKSPDEARTWALGPDEANAKVIEATAVRAGYTVSLEGSAGLG